jgi:hypothetical protein
MDEKCFEFKVAQLGMRLLETSMVHTSSEEWREILVQETNLFILSRSL